MSNDLDILDQHDKEVKRIIQLMKTLSHQDVPNYYSQGKDPMTAIANNIREMDPTFFENLLTAMKKIEKVNPVKPGVGYVTRT